MKKIFLGLLLIIIVQAIIAQQRALMTQYMFNDLVYNPAVAGVKDYVPINLNVREQWTGINAAPSTQSVSLHGYLDYNLGAGAHIFNHVAGPLRRTGLTLSSAYHLKLSKSTFKKEFRTLSFGISGTLFQYTLDKERIKTRIPDDPAVAKAFNNRLVPDVSFGLYYHEGDKFYFGLSSLSLLQTRFDLFNNYEFNINRTVRNYYLTGGANLTFTDQFSIQPSFLGQVIESTPFQIEGALIAYYKSKYFLGPTYRHKDALGAIMGYKNRTFRVSYSFDYTTSDIQAFQNGTHEFNISLFFLNGDMGTGKKYRGNKQRAARSKYKPDISKF